MSLCEKSGLRVALFCNIYEDVEGRVFKIRIKIWYKKWCYIGTVRIFLAL